MIRTSLAAFANRFKLPEFEFDAKSYANPSLWRVEILSGLTVALALVPEAVAFAFVAGVQPLVGLYAAFIVGLITAIFGGRPGMISGATGALAVVMVALVAENTVGHLFLTVMLMGILQILAGIFRLGKFIRMVPYPVMLGFVNGLAIVIFLSQLDQFKVPDTGEWLGGTSLIITLVLVVLTMAIIFILPRLTKVVPAPLAAIVIGTLLVIGFNIDILRVGDLAPIAGGLPSIVSWQVLPPLNWETFKIILPYAVILAAIGLIESLLTLNLVSEMTNKRGGASQECLALGAANVTSGLFGSMGGCAMIGQTMINMKSGGRTRIAAITASLFLLFFILLAAPVIEQIPLASLVGVMFMVVVGTFAWHSISVIRRVPKTDAFVIILVTGVTVITDLAIAVIVGVIVSALVYAWNNASRIHAKTQIRRDKGVEEKIYAIDGPLFFGSATGFGELFDPQNDPQNVTIDFANSRVVDQSALRAIEAIADKYQQLGKNVQLRYLSPQCHQLLKNAGQLVIGSDDDPDYDLAVDYSVRLGRIGSH